MSGFQKLILTAVFLYIVVSAFGQLANQAGIDAAPHFLTIVMLAILFWQNLGQGKDRDNTNRALEGISASVDNLAENVDHNSCGLQGIESSLSDTHSATERFIQLFAEIELAKATGNFDHIRAIASPSEELKKAA